MSPFSMWFILSLSLLFCDLNAFINIREGLTAPFEKNELFDSTQFEKISKLYKTASSQYKYKTQQKHEGIPIFGAHLVFEQDDIHSTDARPVFGTYHAQNDINIDINPKLSSSEALHLALHELNISQYPYDNSTSILYIYPHEDHFYLSYMVHVSSYISAKVIVDAHSGSILQVHDGKKGFMNTCGSGGNAKIGKVSYCGSNAFSINDANAQLGRSPILANHIIQIYDNLNKDYWDKSSASLLQCSFNTTAGYYSVIDRVLNDGYCTGCDVFEFTNFIFDLFTQHISTLPVRDEHIPLKAYVHVGASWDTSNYDDIAGAINFGDGDHLRYPLGVIDIVGHEIGHAFSAKTSGLVNSGESGAIDNFYGDLVGEVAEYFYYGTNDWKVGANSYRSANGAERYLATPSADQISIDSYNDYVSGMNPYYASGIYSKAAYLLNTQYSWSMLDIFKVFSHSNELYWTPYISFNDALCATYQSVTDLYATNTTKVLSMTHGLTQAFDTVAVHCARNQTVTNCGDNVDTYCIYKEIKPQTNKDTSFTVQIALESNTASSKEYNGVNATIYLTVRENTCKVPSVSFEYEMIDLDDDNEFITVRDHDKNVIKQCGQNWHCGIWNTSCITDYKLGIKSIAADNTYTFSINVAPDVGALCIGHNYVVNARLIFKCAQDTPSPTVPQPTASPNTLIPTSATTQPTTVTSHPTPIPTHQMSDCGEHRHCYDVNVYPVNNTDTQSVVLIQNVDESVDVYYDIRLHVFEYDCIQPSISFEYQNIDYDQSAEYIAVYDTNGAEIAICSNGGSDCDRFASCLWRYRLAHIIKANTVYNISIMETSHVDALCDAHDWSINARLYLHCSGGTASPTNIPSVEPTNSPIVPTVQIPTDAPSILSSNPTTSYSSLYECDTNTLCTAMNVIPALDAVTSWKYTLQYGETNADMHYNVIFMVKERDCVNPSISVRYEQIDYDSLDEYIEIYDNNNALIQKCQSGNTGCGAFADCLVDYNLGLDGIRSNTTDNYRIDIFQPRTVNALCSNHTFSINADITLHCDAGTMNPTKHPTQYPSLAPTEPTSDPTQSPTYFRTSCGINRYCYHLAIYPEIGVDKEWNVKIRNANDSTETYFDLFIVPYYVDCVAPSISFEFERIDYNARSEFLMISGSDDNFRTIQCGGDGANNECGVFDTCFTDTSLGINSIKHEDAYKLTVFESSQVEAECKPASDLSINAILSIKCYGLTAQPTAEPTAEPTKEPTLLTNAPSNKPTSQPTDPSKAPTMTPTYDIRACGAHKYCIFEPIYPLLSVDTVFMVPIQNLDEDADVFYDVHFIPNAVDCMHPQISFEYEGIDYDGKDEYINVSHTIGDKSTEFLTTCTDEAFSCGTFFPCLDYKLNVQRIKSNTSYIVHIAQSKDSDALCYDHDFALNARLSIACYNTQSALPTNVPTPEPTSNPTKPTIAPTHYPSVSPSITTLNPTLSPTFRMEQCGVNMYCLHVDLHPNLDVVTEYKVPLVHEDINAAFDYQIIFNVANDIECNDPRLSFTFELIDYDSSSEYINITYNGNELAICGAVSYGQQCGVFADCFNDLKFGANVDKIGLAETYIINVHITEEVDALCEDDEEEVYHPYALNSVLTLSCAKGTSLPTVSPSTQSPTIATLLPTNAPSITPTTRTLYPTLSPTWRVSCGHYIWCYYMNISPSMSSTTTWRIPLQFDDQYFYGSGITFEITYYVAAGASNDCVEPQLSLSYETIDYDGDSEYINVTKANGDIIAECGMNNPDAECAVYEMCFDKVVLQNTIERDQNYMISIYQPSDVDSLCSSVNNPFSINATLILQCESGSAQPSVSPTKAPTAEPTLPTISPTTAIPTKPTLNPTESPTYNMIYCGVTDDRYCVDVAMSPDPQQRTSYTVSITQDDPIWKTETRFDIEFTATGAECVNPMISFVFEKIDYDEDDEYINITYTKPNSQSDVFLTRCGGEGKGYNECGEYGVCLNQTELEGVHKIMEEDSVKISITRSREVGALCWDHELVINAELTLICNAGTASPSVDPTPAPTVNPSKVTSDPSLQPSSSPTTATLSPTLSPTYSHQLCDATFKSNKWCYYVPIHPSDTQWTEFVLAIEGEDDDKETAFEVTFNAQYIDCVKPSITLKYENIDMDGDDEYIEVIDDDSNTVARCGAIWECDTFDYCVKNYELDTETFVAGTNYTITVIEQGAVDGLCAYQSGHSLSINAELSLKCNNGIANVQADDSGTKCGDHKYCFEHRMYPKSIEDTVWQQEIFHLNADEETTEFEISFVSHNERCYEPTLKFLYERIDFDEKDEFIDIYDNNSVLIARCGAGKVTNECGAYDICLSDGYSLATHRGYIEMSDEYKITLFESQDVDAMCRHNHSYSMHAYLIMSCAAASSTNNGLQTVNMSIDIAGSNTFHTASYEKMFTVHRQQTHHKYHVTYNIQNYACLNPTFSAMTTIKVSAKYEQNLWIYDNNLVKIGQCISTDDVFCPHSMKCVTNYMLNETVLDIGARYTFIIYFILDTTHWCDSVDVIHTQLSFDCAGLPSLAPTDFPTRSQTNASPTKAPTILISTTDDEDHKRVNGTNKHPTKHVIDLFNTKTIVIAVIVIVIVFIVCFLLCYFRGTRSGKVKWEAINSPRTETEMQETNRLAMSAPDVETFITPIGFEGPDDETYETPANPTKKRKRKRKKQEYTPIGGIETADSLSP